MVTVFWTYDAVRDENFYRVPQMGVHAHGRVAEWVEGELREEITRRYSNPNIKFEYQIPKIEGHHE
jgi:hypothetical protein